MSSINKNQQLNETMTINGKGLFSKEEVFVSINKGKLNSGIIFIINDKKIPANLSYVTNTMRNTVLSNDGENICLVEHFLSACSIHGISDIEVITNKNELVFNDGSAIHWHNLFQDSNFISPIQKKYELKKVFFIRDKDKIICAIPHHRFKVSYYMDYNHKAIGKLFAFFEDNLTEENKIRLLRARTFASKQENDFFGASDRLLTLLENEFNKPLHEPLEPAFHKVLDIVGDLRLSGINPLEINMHVIAFKSGHSLNVEMAKLLLNAINPLEVFS